MLMEEFGFLFHCQHFVYILPSGISKGQNSIYMYIITSESVNFIGLLLSQREKTKSQGYICGFY